MGAKEWVSIWRRSSMFDHHPRIYGNMVWMRGRYPHLLNDCLALVDVAEFANSTLIGMLAATAAASKELPAREDFFHRVLAKMEAEEGLSAARRKLLGLACKEGWAPE